MNEEIKIIGLTGVATSGKDSLCLCLQEILGFSWERFALADPLKEEVRNDILDSHGIDVMNCLKEDKTKIRPILVAHGKKRREESNNSYWWRECEKNIIKRGSKKAIITDIRFCENESEDEYFWLRHNNGVLIHLTKISTNGTPTPPANEEEAKFDPILKSLSDIQFSWPTIDTHKERWEYVKKNLDIEMIYDKLKHKQYA